MIHRLKRWVFDPFGYREMTERLFELELKVELLSRRLEDIGMAVAQELEALRVAVDNATNAVAARIDKLVQGLKNSMTDAELAAVKAGFQAEIDRLTALGQDPNNPVPPSP